MRKPGLTRIDLLIVIAIMMAAMTSCCSAEDVVVDKGRRQFLSVQRWDMYSWNEHSEGGGLCPTMGTSPEYKPVTKWLDEVTGALAAWQYPMETMPNEDGF